MPSPLFYSLSNLFWMVVKMVFSSMVAYSLSKANITGITPPRSFCNSFWEGHFSLEMQCFAQMWNPTPPNQEFIFEIGSFSGFSDLFAFLLFPKYPHCIKYYPILQFTTLMLEHIYLLYIPNGTTPIVSSDGESALFLYSSWINSLWKEFLISPFERKLRYFTISFVFRIQKGSVS